MNRSVRRSLPLFLFVSVTAAPFVLAQAGTPPSGNPLALKAGPPSAARGAKLAAASCQGCHGPGGRSTQSGVPGLAGQVPSYLKLQLPAFRAKLRPSPVMQQVAGKLSDQDIVDLTAYYSAQKVGAAWPVTNAALRAKGEKLFNSGDAARNIIACAVCHGGNGRGLDAHGIASVTNLAPKYAGTVLYEFRDTPSFGGLTHPEAMRIALKPMTNADMNAVIAYISSMQK